MANNILDKIIKKKAERLIKLKKSLPLESIKEHEPDSIDYIDFRETIETNISDEKISIIAEIKKASPSAGIIVQDYNPVKIAKKFNLKFITIKDLIEYRIQNETLIIEEASVHLPTNYGDFNMKAFKQLTNGQLHLVLIKGEWKKDEPILVRVHSSCMTGDIFSSCRCDCGPQLEASLSKLKKEGKGVWFI